MDWIERMNGALDYIEDNLTGQVDWEKAAAKACCSVYYFGRMFSFLTGVPLSEYLRRRRMTLAGFDLQQGDDKIIDIALKYGYESPEAFTRAFTALHGIPPSAARAKGANLKSYQRITFYITIKGDVLMNYRIVEREAFTVYGMEEIFDMENGENRVKIPLFWEKNLKDGSVDRLALSAKEPYRPYGLGAVNAICGYRETGGTTFPYMLFAFKGEHSDLSGYTQVEVPASTWAAFSTDPHEIADTTAAVQDLTRRIYTEWLPGAGFEKVDGYDMELYYRDEDGRSHCEVWIRVKPGR